MISSIFDRLWIGRAAPIFQRAATYTNARMEIPNEDARHEDGAHDRDGGRAAVLCRCCLCATLSRGARLFGAAVQGRELPLPGGSADHRRDHPQRCKRPKIKELSLAIS